MDPQIDLRIKLQPMSEKVFQEYCQSSVADYAKEMVSAGNISPQNARAASENQFAQLLPVGLRSDGQHLMSIWDLEHDRVVGMVWVGERERGEVTQAVIYDIRVDEPFRKQGYGTQALHAVEAMVRELGLAEIWLHVFGHNAGARRLYERMGYEVTNVTMCKSLNS